MSCNDMAVGTIVSIIWHSSKHTQHLPPPAWHHIPTLFNFFVSAYPDSSLLITSNANDFMAAASSSSPQLGANTLATHTSDVVSWVEEKGLLLSAPKSSVTLFTPDTHKSNLHPIIPLLGIQSPSQQDSSSVGRHVPTPVSLSPTASQTITKIDSTSIRPLLAPPGASNGKPSSSPTKPSSVPY